MRDGKRWGESYTEYHSASGLRVDVTAEGVATPYMSFLFFRNPDRLFIVQGAAVTRVDGPGLRAMEAKAGTGGASVPPRVQPLGTRHSVNNFACMGFQIRRQGLPTRYLCLAAPETLGLPPAVVADTRDMRAMLDRFMTVLQRSGGKSSASFTPYVLPEGYPVRLWESRQGEITWESELLSVTSGQLPTELFRVPEASE